MEIKERLMWLFTDGGWGHILKAGPIDSGEIKDLVEDLERVVAEAVREAVQIDREAAPWHIPY